LISQWQEEAERCFPKIRNPATIYYGSERKPLTDNSLIIITTYGTLSSEFASNPESILFKTNWWRIVLDEAHLIKEKSTKTAKACYGLKAENRWAVTGTPIINKLDDLYSIIKFLKVHPWSQYSFWNSFVTVPFENKNPEALDVVQTILEPLIIRRTKDMKDANENPIVTLPKKHTEIMYLEFSKEEQMLYQEFNLYSKKKLQELKRAGKADYIHIFTLLLRMRQICNHKLLVTCNPSDSTTATELSDLINKHEKTEFRDTFLETLKERKECPICFELSEDDVLLPCLHILCKSCLNDLIDQNQQNGEELQCPFCRNPCEEKDLLQIFQKENQENPKLRKFGFSMSTKLSSLVEQIKILQKDFKDEKIIVFSQWTCMLDFVGIGLDDNFIQSTRLDGMMSKKKRDENLKKFKTTDVPVLLASLRSTGVGLNLTEACILFLI
jgi:DNA repair protein RAD5